MPDLVPPLVRRHRRAFLASAAGGVVAAAGYGLVSAVRKVRMSASRSRDL
ncbi:hypothetical protein [Urbifossiella limnaea]|uniref:Uncharacterized protein n=1 Tax=Urbifossiella limnaea TaxID=2528023 RepID=A0A517XZL7_9BACT|nr:hypothetical protein [Urbifossiella limnaea]QDU22946.1 hypothetical protein ETAA1_49350 [Urbifossiella limnaea]